MTLKFSHIKQMSRHTTQMSQHWSLKAMLFTVKNSQSVCTRECTEKGKCGLRTTQHSQCSEGWWWAGWWGRRWQWWPGWRSCTPGRRWGWWSHWSWRSLPCRESTGEPPAWTRGRRSRPPPIWWLWQPGKHSSSLQHRTQSITPTTDMMAMAAWQTQLYIHNNIESTVVELGVIRHVSLMFTLYIYPPSTPIP